MILILINRLVQGTFYFQRPSWKNMKSPNLRVVDKKWSLNNFDCSSYSNYLNIIIAQLNKFSQRQAYFFMLILYNIPSNIFLNRWGTNSFGSLIHHFAQRFQWQWIACFPSSAETSSAHWSEKHQTIRDHS